MTSAFDMGHCDPDCGWAPPAHWRWHGALAGADPARQPARPALFVPGGNGELEPYPDLAALAARVAGLLAGGRFMLVRTVSVHPDFDPFPAWAVYRDGPAGDRGVPGAPYVACAAVQDVKAATLEAAILEAQASANRKDAA